MATENTDGFVIISPDPRGFWHADYWRGGDGVTLESINLSGCSPDDFITRRGLRPVIEAEARETWPDAEVVFRSDIEDEY